MELNKIIFKLNFTVFTLITIYVHNTVYHLYIAIICLKVDGQEIKGTSRSS